MVGSLNAGSGLQVPPHIRALEALPVTTRENIVEFVNDQYDAIYDRVHGARTRSGVLDELLTGIILETYTIALLMKAVHNNERCLMKHKDHCILSPTRVFQDSLSLLKKIHDGKSLHRRPIF